MGDNILAENSITVFRGSNKTLLLTVTDEDGKAVDLTGATVWFTVKKKCTDEQPLMQKSSSVVTQIEITDPLKGEAKIYIVPSDTQTLDVRNYTFDAWVVLASGKRYPVVFPSVFKVECGVTVIAP